MGGGDLVSYTGADTSPLFSQRWRSRKHIGAARPWMQVQLRRGYMKRSYHDDWPDPQFGQVVGRAITRQWYPDWTPLDAYTTLDTVSHVDLDQSFANNGVCVATLQLDNEEWQSVAGAAGTFHSRERGYFWPWRGYTPNGRPGSSDAPNEWWNRLQNAQITIRQGYGPDAALTTFTGLIDTFNAQVRPDRMTITARDFGGILSDCPLFGWNKDRLVPDPVTFVPNEYWRLPELQSGGNHRWIKIVDAAEIVKCILRWAGFKEWEVEDSGVNLSTVATFDKSKTYMDVINAVKEQLGYVFFMGEPTEDDRSIGVPIFRRSSVLVSQRSRPILLRDQDLLTDIKPQHDNKDDRHIVRVRGAINKQTGLGINQGVARTAASDTTRRYTFVYFPPWTDSMSGVYKQITYYNIGDSGTAVGFTSNRECAVAAVLVALQIGLVRDTATLQSAGNPAFGLDGFAFVMDAGTGIASRLYISNRKSTMTVGGDGSGQQKSPYGTSGGSQSELLWATELGGSLCDNPEMDTIVADYYSALQLSNDGTTPAGVRPISNGGV